MLLSAVMFIYYCYSNVLYIGTSCEMADYVFNDEQCNDERCNVTFHAYNTRASLDITICDDRELENNEIFVLLIDKIHLNEKYGSCIVINETKGYKAYITIVDDDNCKYMVYMYMHIYMHIYVAYT